MNDAMNRPLVGLTMGDVAGIGPEVIAGGWGDPRLHALARPLVIGDPACSSARSTLVDRGGHMRIQTVAAPEEADPSALVIPCLAVAANHGDLSRGRSGIGRPSRRPGRLRVPDDGRRAGPGRPHRRHHDPAAQQTWPSTKAASATPVTPRSWPNTAAWPTTR